MSNRLESSLTPISYFANGSGLKYTKGGAANGTLTTIFNRSGRGKVYSLVFSPEIFNDATGSGVFITGLTVTVDGGLGNEVINSANQLQLLDSAISDAQPYTLELPILYETACEIKVNITNFAGAATHDIHVLNEEL